MSEKYVIFSAQLPNGDFDIVAVSHGGLAELEEADMGPEALFAPRATDIEERGRIQILGDTHLLPDSFSIKG